MKRLYFAIASATVLWAIMFSPLTAPYVNFWWMMSGSACVLAALSIIFSPILWKQIVSSFITARKCHIAIAPNSASASSSSSSVLSIFYNILLGAVIAAALWGIFWIGDKLSQLIFNFARPQVDLIYGMKEGESAILLTVLMLFLIGPAEEIFWRGYVQEKLQQRWNPNIGFIVTTAIYTLVHASSCNFMLTMAAMVAGVVWGILYRFFPQRFAAIIISHSLWDAAVFIWFPIS